VTTTLTAFPAGTPAPYVLVEIDDVPAAAATVTVWRSVGGRQWRVRGMIRIAADGASGLDFEAPFGVEMAYRVEHFDASGAFIGWSDPEVVTLTGLAGSHAWAHNPLDPTTSVQVTMMRDAARSLVRPIPVKKIQIPKRSVAVTLLGTRQGLSGVRLDCYSESLENADRFDALFGGYDDSTVAIVCFRADPAMRLPPTLFVTVAEPEQIPYTYLGNDSVKWRLQGDEASPPAEALVVALLEYADFTAFYSEAPYGDYAAFTAAYADYTQASRDYSISGSA